MIRHWRWIGRFRRTKQLFQKKIHCIPAFRDTNIILNFMHDASKYLLPVPMAKWVKSSGILPDQYPDYTFLFLSREDLAIHNFELVRNFFAITKPDSCINCAAYTAVDKAETETDLAFQVNGEALVCLLRSAKNTMPDSYIFPPIMYLMVRPVHHISHQIPRLRSVYTAHLNYMGNRKH